MKSEQTKLPQTPVMREGPAGWLVNDRTGPSSIAQRNTRLRRGPHGAAVLPHRGADHRRDAVTGYRQQRQQPRAGELCRGLPAVAWGGACRALSLSPAQRSTASRPQCRSLRIRRRGLGEMSVPRCGRGAFAPAANFRKPPYMRALARQSGHQAWDRFGLARAGHGEPGMPSRRAAWRCAAARQQWAVRALGLPVRPGLCKVRFLR